jgi:hypothetical protein
MFFDSKIKLIFFEYFIPISVGIELRKLIQTF